MSYERKSYKNTKCSRGCADKKRDNKYDRDNKVERKEKKHDDKKDKKEECWKSLPEFKCENKCKCVCVDLCVQKNLLTVSRVPVQSFVDAAAAGTTVDPQMVYSQIAFDYEIVLANNTSQQICNVGVFDSLAGQIFAEDIADGALLSRAYVVKAPEYITVLTDPNLISRRGYLNDACRSYLPPCSVSKIVVRLVLTAPADGIREVRFLRNTVTVEGRLYDCNKFERIEPVLAKSAPWCSEQDVMLLIGETLAETAVPAPAP